MHAGGAVIRRQLSAGYVIVVNCLYFCFALSSLLIKFIISYCMCCSETIRVSTGSLVAFQASVDYDVQMVKGFKVRTAQARRVFVRARVVPRI